MATGDAAIDAGMEVVDPATGLVRDGAEEINKTRDYIAGERAARIAADNGKVDKPSDGAGMARREPGSAHSIGFYTTSDGRVWFRPEPSTNVYDYKLAIDGGASGALPTSGGVLTGDLFIPGASPATSGYTVAYINGDGRVSKGASAAKYKEHIDPIDPSALGDIFPQLVEYEMRGGDGDRKVGYIADTLVGTPAERFVVYGGEAGDEVESIDFIALLLAQVAQLQQRVLRLEAGE
ncbi:hypothetical protein [Microbacterium sp. GXF7504]